MIKIKIIPVTNFMQNCTLIWDTKTLKAAIIDPGGEAKKLIYNINNLSLHLQYVLVTHGHFDHINACYEISKKFNVPIYGPQKKDAFLIKGLSMQNKIFGIKKYFNFIPNRWLKEGDKIQFSNIKLNVLHCPGHTPGHIIFVNHMNKFIFSGDVLFKGSIGRTDLPGGDIVELLNSIKEKILPLGDDYQFISGHGSPSNIGAERRSNPFLF